MTRTRSLWIALAAICVIAMVAGASRAWHASATALTIDAIDWRWAALSVVAMLAFVLVYAACWWLLMSELQGRRAPLAAMRLFLLSWPGRYVPASLPHYGGRLVAGPSISLSRSAVAASLVYENVFAIVAAGGVAIVLLAAGYRDTIGGSAWLMAALIAVPAFGLLLHPAIARTAIRISARRFKRAAALEAHVLGPGAILRVGAAYATGSIFAGMAFWCSLRAVGADASPALAIAAYSIGGVAGMLALAVPGGIGVREAVAVGVLSAVVSPPVALSAAVLARLAAILADFLPFVAIITVAGAARLGSAASSGAGRRARSRAA